MRSRVTFLLLIGVMSAATLTAACGQKGPLYHPTPAPKPAPAPAPATTTPPAAPAR